jgi:TPR repeat protein
MKVLSAIGLLACGAATALGRLGEATNEVQARYGAPVGQDSFLGLPAKSYNFGEFNVLVVFKEGRSFIEALKLLENGRRLEANEAEALAARIAGCGAWTRRATVDPPGVEFKGTNGTAAMLRHGALPPDSLVVYSAEAVEKMRKPAPPADPASDLRLQRQQAINGSPEAQCALGKRYLAGEGLAKDEPMARFWLGKAAAKGSTDAKEALKKLDGK